MHPRIVIRKAIVQRLIEVQTLAKKNVFDSRVKPLFDQDMPAILVYTRDEKVISNQYDGDGSLDLVRELDLSIEAVSNSKELDTELDTLAEQIESALDNYEISDRKADMITLKTTETDMAIEGSKVYGAIRLTFGIKYRTSVKEQ